MGNYLEGSKAIQRRVGVFDDDNKGKDVTWVLFMKEVSDLVHA